jgi:hypothetical protein
MTININECIKELVNKKLLIFQRYQVDVKISNALPSGARSIIPYSQLLIFCLISTCIVGSHIEIETIFSSVDIFVNLKRLL